MCLAAFMCAPKTNKRINGEMGTVSKVDIVIRKSISNKETEKLLVFHQWHNIEKKLLDFHGWYI